jgi:hypothetical protein
MKKLILIFSLLLSSLNVSAKLISETKIVSNEDIGIFIGLQVNIDENLQESIDIYELFVEYNEDNPSGPQVSETLLSQVKNVAMFDAIFFAIKQTYIAAVKRDPTITKTEKPSVKDIVNGMLATREIIGPIPNNPLFNAADFERMSTAVNEYFDSPVNMNPGVTEFENLKKGQATQDPDSGFTIVAAILTLFSNDGCKDGIQCFGAGLNAYFDDRFDMNNANKVATNGVDLSTFYTNQNAIQSTCPGGGSCASPM